MSDIIIFKDEGVELSVTGEKDSIWVTQKQIAELFDVKVPAISKHIKNIFDIKPLTKQINLCYNALWKKETQEH